MTWFARIAALLVLCATVASCSLFEDDDSSPGCQCTEEFVMITVAVRDDGGQPLAGLTLTHRITRTDTPVTINQPFADEGVYVVADDSIKDVLRATGDEIWVHGESADVQFDQVFSVNVPGACRCHVNKVSGPDTLVVSG